MSIVVVKYHYWSNNVVDGHIKSTSFHPQQRHNPVNVKGRAGKPA